MQLRLTGFIPVIPDLQSGIPITGFAIRIVQSSKRIENHLIHFRDYKSRSPLVMPRQRGSCPIVLFNRVQLKHVTVIGQSRTTQP